MNVNTIIHQIGREIVQTRLAALLIFFYLLLAPILILNDLNTFDLETEQLGIAAACLGVYMLCVFLSGSAWRELSGHLFLSTLSAWLLLGTGLALAIVLVGTAVAVGLRARFSSHNSLVYGLHHASINGAGVLIAALVYAAGNGDLPASSENIRWPVLSLGLVLAWISTQGMYGLLTSSILAWQPEDRGRLAANLLLAALVIPMALLYIDAGIFVFVALMGLTGVQAIWFSQAGNTQDALVSRAAVLSLLTSFTQNVSSHLVIEQILTNVYEWLNDHTDIVLFYAALYDADTEQFSFPLVIENGHTVLWETQPVDENTIRGIALHTGQKVQINGADFGEMATLFAALPKSPANYTILALPLSVGPKLMGVMVLAYPHMALDSDTLDAIAHQTSMALRNATLYKRTAQLAENLTHINRSVQDIMFNLDSQDAMQIACETAMQITGAPQAAIFLSRQSDSQYAKLTHAVGFVEAQRQYYDETQNLPSIDHLNEIRITTDADSLPVDDHRHQLFVAYGIKAMAEVPLHSGSTPIGLLSVFHKTLHHYDKPELELLETLAYQITAALDNAELLSALEVYASEQSQLVHLSSISTSSLDVQTIIQSVTEIMQHMLHINQAWIGLISPASSQLQLYNATNESIKLDIGQIPEIIAVRDQRVMQLFYKNADTPLSPQLQALLPNDDIQMLAVMPMIANKQVLGLLLLAHDSTRNFNDNEWRFIEMATNQVATQLHNAQLYKDTEAALNRRLQQLALIEDLALQITRALTLDVLIHNVLDAAIRATQADAASLGLMTERGHYRIIGLEHLDGNWIEFDRERDQLPGLMREAIHGDDVIITTDNRQQANYSNGMFRHEYRSSVVEPLQTEEGIIGVLNIESQHLNYFNQEHIAFVKNLSGHAVISIQNARLLQERQYQIDMLTQLRELSLSFSNNMEQRSVFIEVLQTALKIVQGQHAILYSYHPESDQIEAAVGMTYKDGRYINIPTVIPDAIIQRVLQTGEIQIIPDIYTHEAFEVFEHRVLVDYAAVLAAPIYRGGKVMEVLCVTLPRPRARLDTERSTLELLTIQVAGHLENVMLYGRIQANNNRMRAILDSTRDAILLLDRNGRLVDANVSAEGLLNFTLEDNVNRNFAQILMHILQSPEQTALADESLTEFVRDIRVDSQAIKRHAFQLSSSGQIHHIQEVGSPVLDSNNRIIGRLITLRDVTEEIELAKYRDEVTHMIVHDLREPLSSIISSLDFTQEIVRGLTIEDEVVPQLIGVSLESANNLMELVDTILDIAKMEEKRMPLRQVPVEITGIIHNAITRVTPAAQEAQVEITQEIPEDLPPVYVDANMIQRVLINLLGNAVRFTYTGTRILVAVSSVDQYGKVTLRVADSGPGIPPEEADRIFEKFRQIEGRTPAHGRKGSGVGLAFSKQAMLTHRESIWIENEGPLPGATFAFTLPTATEEQIKNYKEQARMSSNK